MLPVRPWRCPGNNMIICITHSTEIQVNSSLIHGKTCNIFGGSGYLFPTLALLTKLSITSYSNVYLLLYHHLMPPKLKVAILLETCSDTQGCCNSPRKFYISCNIQLILRHSENTCVSSNQYFIDEEHNLNKFQLSPHLFTLSSTISENS